MAAHDLKKPDDRFQRIKDKKLSGPGIFCMLLVLIVMTIAQKGQLAFIPELLELQDKSGLLTFDVCNL